MATILVPSNELRFVERLAPSRLIDPPQHFIRILQQKWVVPPPREQIDVTHEWRDVPLVEEE